MEKQNYTGDLERRATTSAIPARGPVRRRHVDTAQFSGRIGGLQEFSVSTQDPNSDVILEKQPDAAAIDITNISALLHLKGFADAGLWKRAAVEMIATAFLTYITGLQSAELAASTLNRLAIAALAGISTGTTLTLLIYCCAPVSGGHLNPTITIAAFCIGMCTLSRAVLYIVAQSAGAVIGAFLLRVSLGSDWFPMGFIPGCGIVPSQTSMGQLFLFEWIGSFLLIFIACGVGLDPRQQNVFGPALSPMLIGVSLALVIFSSAFAKTGYYGVGANPARCLGMMSANHDLAYNWIHWLAALASGLSNGVMYYIIPPYKF
ncbi:aquaporin-like protein [Xylariaceae sp. FL0804]|nr:aquaporin-like protein [Xylariaceae sp. FL0804]